MMSKHLELNELSQLPELRATPFPFNGHKDFSGFTKVDHANFVAGLFHKADDPQVVRWLGGFNRTFRAIHVLLDLGFSCHVTKISIPAGEYEITFRLDDPERKSISSLHGKTSSPRPLSGLELATAPGSR
jgi:hypothetical protein